MAVWINKTSMLSSLLPTYLMFSVTLLTLASWDHIKIIKPDAITLTKVGSIAKSATAFILTVDVIKAKRLKPSRNWKS